MVYKIKNSFMKSRRSSFFAALIFFYFCIQTSSSIAQIKYYRYLNKDGVKVISHTIPPEYSQKGYEIITHTGKVLEVIAPAPDPEELQRIETELAAERALLAEYEVLARRYSTVQDIYAARDRRMAHLDANVAILRSNISNISGQADALMGKAAEVERAGREVPQVLLQNLEETRAELKTTQEMLRARLAEQETIHAEYEEQVALFNQGKAIKEQKRKSNASR